MYGRLFSTLTLRIVFSVKQAELLKHECTYIYKNVQPSKCPSTFHWFGHVEAPSISIGSASIVLTIVDEVCLLVFFSKCDPDTYSEWTFCLLSVGGII